MYGRLGIRAGRLHGLVLRMCCLHVNVWDVDGWELIHVSVCGVVRVSPQCRCNMLCEFQYACLCVCV